MAISNASVTRAKCDACPQVVYAEGGAQPKGFTGQIQEVDGNGRAVAATFFACQPGHVGAAAKNAIKEAKARPTAFAPLAIEQGFGSPEPALTPPAGSFGNPIVVDEDYAEADAS